MSDPSESIYPQLLRTTQAVGAFVFLKEAAATARHSHRCPVPATTMSNARGYVWLEPRKDGPESPLAGEAKRLYLQGLLDVVLQFWSCGDR
jgi:hypothetical protein